MKRFTPGIDSAYATHCFVAGERGMKCLDCNKVMTMAEWSEKRRCFCRSTNVSAAVAVSDREPVRFTTNRINRTIFRNTSSTPANNANQRLVNQDLIELFENIVTFVQSHKRDVVYSSIIFLLGVSLFNSCSQPSSPTRLTPVSNNTNQPRVVNNSASNISNSSHFVSNSYNWRFPRSRCGDTNYSGLQNFYPVYVNRTDVNTLKYLKQNYCRDAFILTRKKSNRRSIQVASFSDRNKAFAFERILLNDSRVKSAEVGEPSLR